MNEKTKKYTVYAAGTAVCVAVLFWLASRVMASGADISYLLLLQTFREQSGKWLTSLMKGFTFLGESSVPVALGAVIYWCCDKRAGARILGFNTVGTGVNQLIKSTACVYRPWVRDVRVTPVPEAMTTATGYSYPSGHTANAGSWTMGLGAWVKDKISGKKGRAALWTGLTLLWLAVGFSRNFLGVHTPQDVGVMILLMFPIMLLYEKIMCYADRGARQESIVGLCGVLFGVLLAVWATVKSYPLDYDEAGKLLVDPAVLTIDTFKTSGMLVGFFIGRLCERKLVRFEVQGLWWQRILRGAAGIALLLAAEKFLPAAMIGVLGTLWGQFAAKIVLFLLITFLYPLAFGAFLGVRKKTDMAA